MDQSQKIHFVKSLWGVTEKQGNTPAQWSNLFRRIKEEGYQAIETPVSVAQQDSKLFTSALQEHGLYYIAQIHTCNYSAKGHVVSRVVKDHLDSLQSLASAAKDLGAKFINSHSGHDSWSLDENIEFFNGAMAIQNSLGIKISHETHRRRSLYNPWITSKIISAVPTIDITADLSHWVVVCERVFDPTEGDDDWPAILEQVANRCFHVHARVGFSEGPQVSHPGDPFYARALEHHLSWWKKIVDTHKSLGTHPIITIEMEFGPPPYLHILPFTDCQPVTDLWDVNDWMKTKLHDFFGIPQPPRATSAAQPQALDATAAPGATKLPRNQLEYLLILDFEAVCNDVPPKPNPQEIIEFPTLLYNTQTQKIDSKFHYYIKPSAHPKLTPFCTQLTGIKQETVDAGVSFKECLRLHEVWLKENGLIDAETKQPLKNFVYVTCGDWDLKTSITVNLGHFKLPRPDYFNHYINIKNVFSNVTKKKAGGMERMLGDLKLSLDGKHHSGIDDCGNICKIAICLQNKFGVKWESKLVSHLDHEGRPLDGGGGFSKSERPGGGRGGKPADGGFTKSERPAGGGQGAHQGRGGVGPQRGGGQGGGRGGGQPGGGKGVAPDAKGAWRGGPPQ